MPINKSRISSPLEAGSSLLDAKQLPPQLTAALEYVSSRLARKGLHLSLIVVRKDTQIPSLPSPQFPTKRPSSPTHSITTSPARSLFSTAATNFTKVLSRHSSRSSLKSDTSSMGSKSPSSRSTSSMSLSRTNWASLPSSPKDTDAFPPKSPSPPPSARSFAPLPSPKPATTFEYPNPYGITLMHASTLTSKAEKILRSIIARAEKKYNIGSGWLPLSPPSSAPTCTLTSDLIRRSLTQNEILFSSEGLTLLSLDHVYIFKCQLHTYSRSLSPQDFTFAVDELRRLVLAQRGKGITKGYLMRAYDWLGVSLAALVDVNEGYKTAYGGKERSGGIEVQNEERQSPPPLQTSFAMRDVARVKICLSGSPSGETPPTSSSCASSEAEETSASGSREIAFGETAKGIELDSERAPPDRGPHRRGAVTPNEFEDITPVTRGSWCFLMVGDGWKDAKIAAVETC